MIKYKNELKKFIVIKNNHPHGDEAYDFEVLEADPEDIIPFINSLLLRQIDEDNKRFLGYVGEDEKHKDNLTHDKDELWCCIDCYDDKIKNKLRAELRNKVNKK